MGVASVLRRLPGFIASLAIAVASGGSFAQSLELVQSTLVVPQNFQKYFDSSRTINLPRGFTAKVFYTGTLSSPRFMDFSPDGTLCVADQSNSTVIALPDADVDGVADTAFAIASGTDNAHSIAFHDGSLFAASQSHVRRYGNRSGTGVYTTNQLFIDSIGSVAEGSPNHTTRTMLYDDASQSLFISVGAPCNACRERDTTRASIQRYDLNGKLQHIYATGLRNAVGLAMDSGHHLWATVAERNNLGADLPGDLITHIEKSGFYGWPYAFGDHRWVDFSATPEYSAMLPLSPADTAHRDAMLPPDLTVAAHSTPLGIVACKNANLPPLYDNAFLVAVHGSYQGTDGRLVANGSKILLLTQVGGKWTSEDFCTGLLTDSINYTRWARPCGIILDRQGNIYFSSDHEAPHVKPAIYRISYDGSDAVARQQDAQELMDVSQDQGGWSVVVHSNRQCAPILYDVMGRPLHAEFVDRGVSADGRVFHLRSQQMSFGMYWISLESDGKRSVRRIIR